MKVKELIAGKLYRYDQPVNVAFYSPNLTNGDILRYVGEDYQSVFTVYKGVHVDKVVHIFAVKYLTPYEE